MSHKILKEEQAIMNSLVDVLSTGDYQNGVVSREQHAVGTCEKNVRSGTG